MLASDRQAAKNAIALFVYRIGLELGSMAAALGGIDAVVFTAGIGENAVQIRRQICENAGWLGIDLDANANAANGPRISRAASRTSAWVIPTDENLTIARHACTVHNAMPCAGAPRELRADELVAHAQHRHDVAGFFGSRSTLRRKFAM